jgi:hypothetical protein
MICASCADNSIGFWNLNSEQAEDQQDGSDDFHSFPPRVLFLNIYTATRMSGPWPLLCLSHLEWTASEHIARAEYRALSITLACGDPAWPRESTRSQRPRGMAAFRLAAVPPQSNDAPRRPGQAAAVRRKSDHSEADERHCPGWWFGNGRKDRFRNGRWAGEIVLEACFLNLKRSYFASERSGNWDFGHLGLSLRDCFRRSFFAVHRPIGGVPEPWI